MATASRFLLKRTEIKFMGFVSCVGLRFGEFGLPLLAFYCLGLLSMVLILFLLLFNLAFFGVVLGSILIIMACSLIVRIASV